jgi:asparagine synthase (glutamine-hydrolysing)
VLPDLVRRYGEPFGDSSAIPTWHLARLARGTVPMVLSGDGGDEAFGGYDTYRDWQRWLTGLGQPAWRLALRRLAALIAPSRWPPRAPTPANWVRFVQCLGDHQRRRLWRPEQDPGGGILPAAFAPTDAAGLPPLSLAQRLDLGTYLPGDILTKVDIASMAHGLEVRTPLVDRMVVEFAATIPADLNPRDAQGGWRSKALFKDALIRAGLYDRAFLDRPKQGFAMPMARWLAPHGPLRHQAEERLLAAQSPLTAWFRPAAIRQLLAQGRHGPVWLLLVLDEWLRQHPEAA